jgi:hypothetical protein
MKGLFSKYVFHIVSESDVRTRRVLGNVQVSHHPPSDMRRQARKLKLQKHGGGTASKSWHPRITHIVLPLEPGETHVDLDAYTADPVRESIIQSVRKYGALEVRGDREQWPPPKGAPMLVNERWVVDVAQGSGERRCEITYVW